VKSFVVTADVAEISVLRTGGSRNKPPNFCHNVPNVDPIFKTFSPAEFSSKFT